MERLTDKHRGCTGYYMKCAVGCDSYDCGGCSKFDSLVNRLGEYEYAEEQGLLMRLPCKVGAEVWRIETGCCIEREMDRCSAYCDGFDYPCADYKAERTIVKSRFALSDIPFMGEFVFITRSEAEAALAKEGGAI